GQSCGERKEPQSLIQQPNAKSSIKKVIGVVSGKGGVGKSLVTAMMAVLLHRRGFHTGVLDADITGPSIPKAFGIHGRAMMQDQCILPCKSKTGIDVMSVNLMLENETDPVVWRGPIIANMVTQFWTDVLWKDIDFLFVDMPPGTGDVPLTVFQSIPIDGILIVTSPQELVSMIVAKAVTMANMMNVPIIGVVENMSYVQCPHCGEKIAVFGQSHLEETAKEHNLKVLAHGPLDPQIAAKIDKGQAEEIDAPWLDQTADAVQQLLEK
ncbi:MAG: Mrp/NBP35 family ATP-binding protein, partial [Oscillospiraceae bacterium]|nr:Mrp/NBP35 family ATP-binding protein [Oscillospiraceae bacterium]